MNFNKLWLAAAIGFCAMQLSGCTTTDGASDPAMASFAPMPDLAMAPVPTAKPDTPEANASLAAQVENDTDALMQAEGTVPTPQTKPVVVAMAAPAALASATDAAVTPVSYAPAETKPAVIKVGVPQKPAIPEDAVDVANAAPVMEAAVGGGQGARECLMRAMYFESNRSSRDGQLAVGTVVMNRVAHGAWGKSVCGVVGARQQFAPGVMSRRMQGDTEDLAALADSILKGKRHPKLARNVMFFHVAGMKFKYRNMRYVLVAGGNTFYYKAGRKRG